MSIFMSKINDEFLVKCNYRNSSQTYEQNLLYDENGPYELIRILVKCSPDQHGSHPACEPCSCRATPRRSLLVMERPGMSLGAPGGQHGSFGKFKTAAFLRDGPGRWQHPGWSVQVRDDPCLCRVGPCQSVALPSWASLGGGQGGHVPPLFAVGGTEYLMSPPTFGEKITYFNIYLFFTVIFTGLIPSYPVNSIVQTFVGNNVMSHFVVYLICNIFEDRHFYNDSMEIMSSTCKFQCIFQKIIQCTWWCITDYTK